MRILFLFSFFLFINLTSSVTQTDIGIKIVLTQPGLSELLLIVDQSLTEIANEKEPIYIPALPPIVQADTQINITNVTIVKTSHNSLAGIILPGDGLAADMKGISAEITFDMSYKIKQGRMVISGQDFVDFKIDQTEAAMILNISATDEGIPLVVISNVTIDVGTLVFDETGDWESLQPIIEGALLNFLETSAPLLIEEKVNELLFNLTSQLPLSEIPLTPGTALNLTLPNNPYTSDSLTLVVDLRGFAYVPSDGLYGFYHGCASPMTIPIEPKFSFGSRMLQLALSDQVANCLAETLFVTYQLNMLVDQLFLKFIDGISPGPMQEGLEIGLSCTLPPTISSSAKNGITINIPAEITWTRSPPIYPVAEQYVSLYSNLSLSVLASISNNFLHLNFTAADLELGTAYTSPSMPKHYKDQVDSTEWAKLNMYLKGIIATLLPFLNEKLSGGFPLPEIGTERITFGLEDLEIYDGYIVASTSFVGKDKK